MPLISTERVYTGRIVNLNVDTVAFPDGSTGQLEMLRHPGASAIVPFLDDPASVDPRIVLIRQFRHAAEGDMWEIPAGRLDPGEEPEACARRELREETGFSAVECRRLVTIYTTPGFTDERIHLFLGTGLRAGDHAREADEFVEVHEVPWSEALRLVQDGQISDAKTLSALLFTETFLRRGSRAAAGY
ncbi:MAG: NUDIX domain-containing protein [Gemmatimonadota bacterium]